MFIRFKVKNMYNIQIGIEKKNYLYIYINKKKGGVK
jgi:hypothetical protein